MFPWLRQRAPKPEKWCNTKELIAKRIVTYMLKGCIKNYSVVIYNKVLLMIHNYIYVLRLLLNKVDRYLKKAKINAKIIEPKMSKFQGTQLVQFS